MLHCCEVFNPSRCFFTAHDFEDTLLTIDSLLKDYETRKADPKSHFDRAESKAVLEKAYSLALSCLNLSGKQGKPDKQLIFLLGDILRQYGHLCYTENFFISKQVFLAALNMHFYAIDMLNSCFDMQEFKSLEDLSKRADTKPNLFAVMEEHVLTTHVEGFVSAALSNTFALSYPTRRLLNVADNFRWLGHCYQHLDSYQAPKPVHDHLFRQLFSLSEGVLFLVDDERSRRELADLYFQASPYMHQRQKPEDVQVLCGLFNKVLSCDSSPEMQIRVANMRFLFLFKAQQRDEARMYLQQALELSKGLPDNDQNQFLLANLHNNCAGYFMDPQTVDLERAQSHLNKALLYAAKNRAAGEDRFYFAIYDMRLAELKLVVGQYSQAKEAIERAIKTLQKNPESQQAFIGKAEALRSIINDALRFGPNVLE